MRATLNTVNESTQNPSTEDPSPETMVAALHMLVKQNSTVPKVADAIGMNYYSLRDNLTGKSEIKLKTFYAVLAAIGVSMEELRSVAAAMPGSAQPNHRQE